MDGRSDGRTDGPKSFYNSIAQYVWTDKKSRFGQEMRKSELSGKGYGTTTTTTTTKTTTTTAAADPIPYSP